MKVINNLKLLGLILLNASSLAIIVNCGSPPLPEWTKVSTSGPSARTNPVMAYDKTREKLVLFGGSDGSSSPPAYGRKNDTWEWDGEHWSNITSQGRPSMRSGHAMVFNDESGKIMLFGGRNYSEIFRDTWEWDGNKWTMASNIGAQKREPYAMAYDAKNRKVILLLSGVTWEWHGNKWTRHNVSGPAKRMHHTMAYDIVREKVILFGGLVSKKTGYVCSNDTWEWDGSIWKEITISNSKPSPRWGQTMIYHGRRKKIILFGGFDYKDNCLNDLWEFNGKKWHQLVNDGLLPPPRGFHGMAYDSMRDKIVLFGGKAQPQKWYQIYNDTWEW